MISSQQEKTSLTKHFLREKKRKKIFQAGILLKYAGLAVIIFDKVNPNLFRIDKEGNTILMKGTIYQEEITIVNFYVPNVGVANFT
jgi:hypothetical protein